MPSSAALSQPRQSAGAGRGTRRNRGSPRQVPTGGCNRRRAARARRGVDAGHAPEPSTNSRCVRGSTWPTLNASPAASGTSSARRHAAQVRHEHPLYRRLAAVRQNDWTAVEQAIPEELLAIKRLPRTMHEWRPEGRDREAGRPHAGGTAPFNWRPCAARTDSGSRPATSGALST